MPDPTPEDAAPNKRPLGRLLPLRRHAEILGLKPGYLRDLVKGGKGPPLFRRPGSSHFIGYEGETRDWLYSNRNQPAAGAS